MTYLRIEDGGLECHEDQEEEILPGFRFHPTDEELIDFYLRSKVMKKKIKLEIIKEIDIYKFDPWDLPSFSNLGSEENEWYFFCLRGRKYKNSIRPNRVTGSGFWKATGIDKPVYSSKGSHCVGLKKSLVYYRGFAGKGTKTDWMMHEFRLPPGNSGGKNTTFKAMHEAEIWTICRIFKRIISYKNHQSQYHQTHELNPNPRSSNTSSQHHGECEDHQKALEKSEVVIDENKMSPPSQTSSILLTSGVDTDEFIEDVNWDELGRILDIVLEPALELCP